MEQKWFGWIEEMNDKSFNVKLKNLTPENFTGDGKFLDHYAEISYTDITEKDRETIKLGSTFYWTTITEMDKITSNIEFIKPTLEDEESKRDEIAKRFYKSIIKSKLFK